MSFETWIAFIFASSVLLVIPGPSVLMVIGYSLQKGRSSVLATGPGIVLGDLTAMTCSFLGIGATLATSAFLFSALKFIGAGYLLYLGIAMWRNDDEFDLASEKTADSSNRKIFFKTYIANMLHPKSYIFFMSFVPQFIVASKPLTIQLLILGGSFLFLTTANVVAWTLFTDKLRLVFRKSPFLKSMNKLAGSILIGASLFTAYAKRPT